MIEVVVYDACGADLLLQGTSLSRVWSAQHGVNARRCSFALRYWAFPRRFCSRTWTMLAR